MRSMLPAGWYADPSDATRYRYWTGAEWTTDVLDRFEIDGSRLDRPLPDLDPPVGQQPTAPRPRRRWGPRLAVVGALLVVLATAGVALRPDPGGPALTGELRVAAGVGRAEGNAPDFVADGTRCGGTGDDDGLGAGSPVALTAGGRVLGRTALSPGRLDRTLSSSTCVFTYRIEDVDDAEAYTLRVNRRPVARAARSELESAGWRLDASLG